MTQTDLVLIWRCIYAKKNNRTKYLKTDTAMESEMHHCHTNKGQLLKVYS